MKTIRIFDFDQTISKEHTFNRTNDFSPESNIKDGINQYFLHDRDNVAAVATFHNNPEYIKLYIEKILGKKLTLLQKKASEHDVLSIYIVEGESVPLLISTVNPDNYNQHQKKLSSTGKNTQIQVIEPLAKLQKH